MRPGAVLSQTICSSDWLRIVFVAGAIIALSSCTSADESSAICATGFSRSRANSTARWRSSGGWGRGIWTSFPRQQPSPQTQCPSTRGTSIGPSPIGLELQARISLWEIGIDRLARSRPLVIALRQGFDVGCPRSCQTRRAGRPPRLRSVAVSQRSTNGTDSPLVSSITARSPRGWDSSTILSPFSSSPSGLPIASTLILISVSVSSTISTS